MVPLIGHANIMRYACIQSCRIDLGVVYLMIIRIKRSTVNLSFYQCQRALVGEFYKNQIDTFFVKFGFMVAGMGYWQLHHV